LDHQDAKNSKISNIFTKIALSQARMRQKQVTDDNVAVTF